MIIIIDKKVIINIKECFNGFISLEVGRDDGLVVVVLLVKELKVMLFLIFNYLEWGFEVNVGIFNCK